MQRVTGRSGSTVRPAATSACAATWPPKTRCCASSGLTPRKRLTSSGSSSRSSSNSSSGDRPTRAASYSRRRRSRLEELGRDGLRARGRRRRSAPGRCRRRGARPSSRSRPRGPRRWPRARNGSRGSRSKAVGRAAPQHVPEDRDARVESGARLDLGRERVPIPPRRTWPNSSTLAGLGRHRALQRRAPSATTTIEKLSPLAVAVLDAAAHLVDVEGHLGDEDDVGAAGDTRVQRDPAGVAPHHLAHHHPVVALGGRVQTVDGVGRDLHRGVEAERDVGRREVVVDRLGHADDATPSLAELRGDAERVLAADRDQRVDSVLGRPRRASLRVPARRPSSLLYGIRARRAEDRAPPPVTRSAAACRIRPMVSSIVSSSSDAPPPGAAEADDLVARRCPASPLRTHAPGMSPR